MPHAELETLFGREVELANIRRFLQSIRHGGDMRMVRGEPGVGKSALLAAAADLADAEGMRVLPANGSEFEAEISYSLLNQLLLPLYTDMQKLPPALRDALTVALGFGSGPAPAALLVCNAALMLLTTVAKKKPALLIVDDVQWVDRPSAVVLGFVARRVRGTPVGVIAASRTGTESFLDSRGLTEVTVDPLSDEASARLVDTRFPALTDRVRQRLLDLAQGNPLALLELPGSLTDSTPPADVVPLSDRLQTIFATRIAGLPESTRLLLLLATFEGSGDLRTLRGLADLAPLAAADRAQLVRVNDAGGRIVFGHPLIQSAIVAMSTSEERQQAHQAIAAALPGDPERRAWHLAAATVGPDEVVAAELEEAAHVVLRRGDAFGAVAALVRAAEMSSTPEDAARRLAEAAYTGAEAGVAGDATTLLADARSMSQGPAGALHAANATALLMINGDGDVRTAHRLLAGAIETGEHGWRADDQALDEAMHTLLLLSSFASSPDHWATFHRLLARLQPEPGDLLSVLSRTFTDPVRTAAAALPDLEALIAALPGETDLTRIVRTGTASAHLSRLGDLREHSWRLVRQGREGGAPQWQVSGLMHLCEDDYYTGRWDEVEELAAEGERVADESGLPFLRWYFLLNRAVVAAGRGRFGEAYDLADEITHWAAPRGVAAMLAVAHLPRTLAAAAAGDFEAAYRHATTISPAGVLAPYAPTAMWVMLDVVEAAQRTGRTAEARAHAEAMRTADVAALSTRMRLIQHGVDALVLDDEAGDRLEQALADPATERWLFDSSRIRLVFAEKLRRRKEYSRAGTHLLAARTGFAAIGAEPWLDRTVGELRAAGHRPTAADRPPAALTTQEMEIANLAAAGLTNKQIAQRLYLSHRTVGAHLYRVFPKLGVTSRAGLRDALNHL
ncbi:helix-turn-helix transcriptional regulator [Cryptosporangium arvum]|uniref:Transcriptional regulator, luxR family n=1 Tax=Cryptosporangium arvum DSM 44712 TaxID=927661 RepID=A0A010Z4W9_9ACTN|nr:LuxR family transcriptional regulator [Cryptosporangium arvum]EXG82393.1 transcriptional regulator, luxR family [Cryptosporangium arvum DSM 44712]